MTEASADSPTQVVTIGAVAVLVILKCFELLKARSQRNGHASPNPASVSLASAPDFALMQRTMLQNDEDAKKRLDRIEAALDDIRDEVLDASVRKHHRS